MNITYFGVRGSCPCSSDQHRRYGGNTSCVLVEVDGEPPLILDLGTGLRALGETLRQLPQRAGAPLEANALLTHLHYDHMLGLPFFPPLRDPGTVLTVYGPTQTDFSQESPAPTDSTQTDLTLHDALASAVQPPFFPIPLSELPGEVRSHDLSGADDLVLGDINVKARSVLHRGHTLGFRVEAAGQAVAYLPDHQAPTDHRTIEEGVLELCDGADLVIHDAQYTDDEFATKSDWGHSTVAYAMHVAAESGARRLSLFHHDPLHTDEEIDRMLADAVRLASHYRLDEVTAACEGWTIDLGKV